MKTPIYLLIAMIVIMSGCENIQIKGELLHKVKFTTEQESQQTGPNKILSENSTIETYSDLGDYVTSITPFYYFAKLNIMMYLDNWDQSNNSTHMISYIDGHDNDPNQKIELDVDFSNNQEVSLTPILYSTDKWGDIFKIDEVTMNYFFFIPYYIIQSFEIPEEYGNIQLNINGSANIYTDSISGKKICTLNSQTLSIPIFKENQKIPMGFIFGGTDSTFIYNKDALDVPISEDNPWGGKRAMIRSDNFSPVTVKMPLNGETFEMYSTVSYDTRNLIQIYAGNDNLPFTSDDVFVYAPKYWERLKIKLEVTGI